MGEEPARGSAGGGGVGGVARSALPPPGEWPPSAPTSPGAPRRITTERQRRRWRSFRDRLPGRVGSLWSTPSDPLCAELHIILSDHKNHSQNITISVVQALRRKCCRPPAATRRRECRAESSPSEVPGQRRFIPVRVRASLMATDWRDTGRNPSRAAPPAHTSPYHECGFREPAGYLYGAAGQPDRRGGRRKPPVAR